MLTGSQMSLDMIDYPDASWTRPQLMDHIGRIAWMLQSKAFKPSMPFTLQSQLRWIDLIRAVSDLVRQAAMAGKRVCFTDQVSTLDDKQDITSLLDSMRQSAHVVIAVTPAQRDIRFIFPAFNHHNSVGVGQFTNGLLFTCPYADDQAFFIGRDRIYLKRHIRRAYAEARDYLFPMPDRK